MGTINTGEALRIALRSLRSHKLRSILTMLGIIVGVTAVIVLVGLGNGMKAGFDKTFGELAKAIIVDKVTGTIPGGGAPKELRDTDVAALRKAPAVSEVTPLLTSTVLLKSEAGPEFRGQAMGSTIDFLGVSNRELSRGRMFSLQEEQTRARVVALGPETVKALYAADERAAVGSNVRIGNTTFTVIGVLKSDGGNFDDIALMPLSSARTYVYGGTNEITSMAVKANSVNDVEPAVAQINEILDDRHRIQEPAKRDFRVTSLRAQMEQIQQFMGFLSAFIVAVAAISLLVGAIGVANIMLVSVTERTREIGIRKAIGAKRSAIMKQFLIESVALAGLGGLVGVAVGVGLVLTAAEVIPRVAPDFGTPTVSWEAVALALGTSLAIGLVAGGYPALRAAFLRPVEALRRE